MATPFFLMRLNDHVQYLKKIEATRLCPISN
jgi:hypothetical protein